MTHGPEVCDYLKRYGRIQEGSTAQRGVTDPRPMTSSDKHEKRCEPTSRTLLTKNMDILNKMINDKDVD